MEYQNDYSYLWIIVLILVITIVILFFAWLIWFHNFASNQLSNTKAVPSKGSCISDGDCQVGLNCINQICLALIGQSCHDKTDCIAGATSCLNGSCTDTPLGNIGDPSPCSVGLISDFGVCKVPIGGMCQLRSDCVNSASECKNNICIKVNKPFGSKCRASAECDNGYFCENRMCKISPLSFIPCCSDDMCGDGSICTDNRCQHDSSINSTSSS